ncbi:MAG: tetratricopeptide repeat protein [Crocosphaera sp.]|nr:tetratricopeptide repeat protein [Crocosphaera sp.]
MLRRLFPILLTVSLVATPYVGMTQTVEQLFQQGNQAHNEGNYREAESIFREIITIDSNNAGAYVGIGLALDEQGKLEEAIAAYKKALEINPNYGLAYYNIGVVLQKQGKLEEAIAAYKKAIDIDPNFAWPHNNIGLVLYDQGKLEEAIAAFEKAIEIDPNDALAQNNLKEAQRLLARKNDPPPPTIDDRDYLPTETQEPLLKKLRSTARIIATTSEGASIGTGWVIQRQGNTVLIVTNRHVISDKKSKRPSNTIEVEFYSTLNNIQRPRYQAKIEQITDSREDLDLAVLKVEAIPDDIEALTIKSGWIQRSLEITIIGHPYNINTPWSAVKGEVMNYDPNNNFIPLDALVADGNSGGPVLNAAGEVIAMMVGIRLKNDLVAINNRETPIFLEDARSTGDVGLAYRIEIVMEKLQDWGVLSN